MTRPPFESVEGVEGAFVWSPGERALRVEIDADATLPESTPEIDAAWEAMRRANPRLHDGGVLSAIAIDPDACVVRCVRDRYRRLATLSAAGIDPPEPTPVLTSVIGLLIAPDRASVPHVLIGRRAPDTRLFGGRWESAPAGGLDPDLATDGVFQLHNLFRQVNRELGEETGLTLRAPAPEMRTACVVWTPEARSYDIVLLIIPGERITKLDPAAHADAWEYDDVRWLPVADVPIFAAEHDMTPQFRAAWHTLGVQPD